MLSQQEVQEPAKQSSNTTTTELSPLGEASIAADAAASPNASSPPEVLATDQAVAAWNKDAGATDGDLFFEAEDRICITAKDEMDWWTGYVEGAPDTIGHFPRTFMLSQQEVQEPAKQSSNTTTTELSPLGEASIAADAAASPIASSPPEVLATDQAV